ncbi:MAG: metalloregulator ArsR/SmtB family transcription factor [Chloroflexi bacterium]|nr:metalloregulator ArsR/SmtB family transcription factor [Chloroflexota bacterium]
MSHRGFKQRLYPEFARIAHALASDRRLELIDLLAQGPRHVEALAVESEMSVANVSQHLQVLRAAHLVETERRGTKTVYRLAGDDILRLWLALRGVAEHRLSEIPQLVRQYAVVGVEGSPFSWQDVEGCVQRGEVTLIDVRPALEFEHGHIPGAISVPPDELGVRLDGLPHDRPIVAYCRGAYCLFADEAVALLRQRGAEAYRLDGGWSEWLVSTGHA